METESREYIRARTSEQKEQRLADILDATEALLDERHYRDVTMVAIADRLGYSRANLSHYVRSKEEILLLLYVRSLRGMLDDMKALGAEGLGGADVARDADAASDDIVSIAKRLAALVARHEDFGRIGALLASIIETNVGLDCLVACKRKIVDAIAEASELLAGCGLFPDGARATEFLIDLSHYVSGLYPASHPVPIQKEAAREVGFAIPGYRASLERYLAVQIAGYRAMRLV